MRTIWIFHGESARMASGVFSTKELADIWIEEHKLSGLLTEYPIDTGVYDWATLNKLFVVKKDSHRTAQFKQRFTSAKQTHYHYENGENVA